MGKLLLWLVVLLAALTVWRIVNARASVRQRQEQAPPATGRAAPRGGKTPAEAMVRCAHCGIHLPRSEALLLAGKTWCSQDHARQGPRA